MQSHYTYKSLIYEPETVFHMFNELFLLMCIPSLDQFLRNIETGKLKEMRGFIVAMVCHILPFALSGIVLSGISKYFKME